MQKGARMNSDYERGFHRDKRYVVGLDEAGRGALAGPVAIGWAVLPLAFFDKPVAVMESKSFTETGSGAHEKRLRFLRVIDDVVCAGGSTLVNSHTIDSMGINAAITVGVMRAVDACRNQIKLRGHSDTLPSLDEMYLLCDNGMWKFDNDSIYSGKSIVKGDLLCPSIAIASNYAKTKRDRYMISLSSDYPEFDFDKNMGYYGKGTVHTDAIMEYGYTPEHRVSFNPLRTWVSNNVAKEYCSL